MSQANSHSTWALASQGGYLRQIANFGRRYATTMTIACRRGSSQARPAGQGLSSCIHENGTIQCCYERNLTSSMISHWQWQVSYPQKMSFLVSVTTQ